MIIKFKPDILKSQGQVINKGQKFLEFLETCFFRELDHSESLGKKKFFSRKNFWSKIF